jgi:hypothetical protein
MSEIRLRAVIRIGELSRELEKAEHGGAGGGSKFPPLGTSKEQALAEAGLSTSTANRYEQLVGRADWAIIGTETISSRSTIPAYVASGRSHSVVWNGGRNRFGVAQQ